MVEGQEVLVVPGGDGQEGHVIELVVAGHLDRQFLASLEHAEHSSDVAVVEPSQYFQVVSE